MESKTKKRSRHHRTIERKMKNLENIQTVNSNKPWPSLTENGFGSYNGGCGVALRFGPAIGRKSDVVVWIGRTTFCDGKYVELTVGGGALNG